MISRLYIAEFIQLHVGSAAQAKSQHGLSSSGAACSVMIPVCVVLVSVDRDVIAILIK